MTPRDFMLIVENIFNLPVRYVHIILVSESRGIEAEFTHFLLAKLKNRDQTEGRAPHRSLINHHVIIQALHVQNPVRLKIALN